VEEGFLPVGQIVLGMHLVEADGQTGVVSGWTVVPGVMTMYNLEVAQDHTFVVGVGMWVVHNCGDLTPGTFTDNTASHTFLDKLGHVAEDTPENRSLFENLTSQSKNFVGTDSFGNHWFAQTEDAGSQLWARARDVKGVKTIISAGRNLPDALAIWDPVKGLTR
jgi:hypothetical protein